jgi:hypothetical protein
MTNDNPIEGNKYKVSVPIYHYYNQKKFLLRFIFDNKRSRRIDITGHKSISSYDKIIFVPIEIQKSQIKVLNITSSNGEILYLKSISYL